MISKEIIEEIKRRNDIEEVISQYVTLKRAGSNANGLCPFHSEKTPSFTVFKGTDSFYCFGCGAGGDVITFVMKAENLDYVGALEFLAKRAGITIPTDSREPDSGMRRTRVLEMNREAAKFFHDQLKNDKVALNYLTNRGLSNSVIKHFGIGFAPPSFGALTDHMHKLGYTDEELQIGFLAGKSQKTGRAYDYFRNRVIFPIINTSGEVVAFGGRVMDDSKPKYLNTSDTPAFKKSKNLFALNYAKNFCTEQMILCEGYMDVIALHAAGFQNAIATLGTALTSDQARLMKKYTQTVLICYDSDEAGQRAANKAFALLGEAGLETRILRMEGAKDPDEYIQKHKKEKDPAGRVIDPTGKSAFQKVIDSSYTQFDYKFEAILKKYDINLTDDRIKAADAAAQEISVIYSSVERDIYIKKTADKLNISAESLKRDVENKIRRRRRNESKDEKQKMLRAREGYGDRVNPDRIKNLRASSAEEVILGIMLKYHEYADKIRSGKFELASEDFVSEFSRRVFDSVMSAGEDFEIGMLNGEYTDAEMARIVKLQIAREGLSNTDEVFSDSIKTLKSSGKRAEMSLEDIIAAKRSKQ